IDVVDQKEAVAPILLSQHPPSDGPRPTRPGVEAELADPLQARDVGHLDADGEVFPAGEPQFGEAEAEGFPDVDSNLVIEVASGSGQFQSSGTGVEPKIRVARRERLASPGESVGQADPSTFAIEQGTGDDLGEIELSGSG